MIETEFETMDDVKNAHRVWFSPGNMRFFGTRVETELIEGRYFITSEKPPHGRRGYTLRSATKEDIDTIGDLCGYGSLGAARAALEELTEEKPSYRAPAESVNKSDPVDYLFWRLTEKELPDESAATIKAVLDEVVPLAKEVHGLHEVNCNYGWTDEEESRVDEIRDRIEQLFKSIGCGAEFNGDPRGAPVFLKVPSGNYDDMGHRGLVIPFLDDDEEDE